MKGLILAYLIAYAGAIAALRYPLIGLNVFVGLAVLRPQSIFGFAGDLSGLSNLVGIAVLIGWALNGFGSWRFGRGWPVIGGFFAFTAWFLLSAVFALNTTRAYDAVIDFSKLVLPLMVGMTMMKEEKDWRPMLWTIVLAQGYVGFEMNNDYLLKGYNSASAGFGGMDNNCFGVSLVTVLGPAIALMISSQRWIPRLLAGLSAALILHTTLLTFSRGAMIGLLAVAVTAFVMMPKRPKYLGALVVIVLLALRFTGPQLWDRYATAFVPEDERDMSAQSRVDLWRDCLMVVNQFPVFGVGPANWRVIASSYGWPEGKSAHSVWMETAAENGIPGALALLFFFTVAAIKLWPIARARITAENQYQVILASGVILSVVGFSVAGQFVSVPGLEVPYYITMLGGVMLKTSRRDVTVGVPAAGSDRLSPSVSSSHLPGRPAIVRPAPAAGPVATNPASRSVASRTSKLGTRPMIVRGDNSALE